MNSWTTCCVVVIALLICGIAGADATEPFSHQDWAQVLRDYVDDEGLVDYRGLAGNRESLDRYVASVRAVSPLSAPRRFPTRNHELAYYLNAYNALVFDGVLSRGPEEKSVWRGVVSGYTFFVKMKVMVGGEKMSLKKLEDDEIRAVRVEWPDGSREEWRDVALDRYTLLVKGEGGGSDE